MAHPERRSKTARVLSFAIAVMVILSACRPVESKPRMPTMAPPQPYSATATVGTTGESKDGVPAQTAATRAADEGPDVAPIVQIGTTDQSGLVGLPDPGTGETVNVTVVDANQVPLSGMTVEYEHGVAQQYEAFFVRDPQDMLVGVGFFVHNSDHTIVVEPNVMRRVNPDQARALAGYVDRMKRRSQDFYKETITCEEYEAVIERAGNFVIVGVHIIAAFYGVHAIPPVELFAEAPLELVYEGGKEPCTGQWDHYESYSAAAGRTELLVYVQSQPPEMQSVNIGSAQNGSIQASWMATDRTEYPKKPYGMIMTIDHTIFEGPTAFSDLTYSYRVLAGYSTIVKGWTETRQAEATISDLPPGSYVLEVVAVDEVGNRSSAMQQPFEVKGVETSLPTMTSTLMPPPTSTPLPTKTPIPMPTSTPTVTPKPSPTPTMTPTSVPSPTPGPNIAFSIDIPPSFSLRMSNPCDTWDAIEDGCTLRNWDWVEGTGLDRYATIWVFELPAETTLDAFVAQREFKPMPLWKLTLLERASLSVGGYPAIRQRFLISPIKPNSLPNQQVAEHDSLIVIRDQVGWHITVDTFVRKVTDLEQGIARAAQDRALRASILDSFELR